MQNKLVTMPKEKLENLVETLREKLYQSYKENGLDSDTTINISQELDVILNVIQILKLK
ncbi:aspartyl-phosphate phosphatase Spo0E family protein [Sutcliffiella horikoshii]|uniref:aspartyl-phosphate phosphatase Spo0E family protein n=1 Tax=Sutcliffiella horikoshii TaxID=79883 RepID=UPI001CC0F6B5|nr:aspartyl-phosphate phosphatase Spo0E family protein [Sutcliffiella horikoshii]UAL47127.1 aspartyl-phosphate phosphatase Spo0E family protein [Sutcliffiella horikoshii]